jgi:hypothetical protein
VAELVLTPELECIIGQLRVWRDQAWEAEATEHAYLLGAGWAVVGDLLTTVDGLTGEGDSDA